MREGRDGIVKYIKELEVKVKERDIMESYIIFDKIMYAIAQFHAPKVMKKINKIKGKMRFWYC